MTRPAARMARLVGLARRREEQARQRVGAARQAERHALDAVEGRASALRGDAVTAPQLRFQQELRDLGRHALTLAEHRLGEASGAVAGEVTSWRQVHQRLQTLERLEARHLDAARAERQRREQIEQDELAGTRGRAR